MMKMGDVLLHWKQAEQVHCERRCVRHACARDNVGRGPRRLLEAFAPLPLRGFS